MVLLTRLAKQVYRRSSEELLGMHLRHLMALSYLRDHDGGPQQELAEALCMDANNVVLLLNELEDLGWSPPARPPGPPPAPRPPDGAGRRELDHRRVRPGNVEADVLRGLEPAERAILRELLARALREAEPVELSTS